MGSPKGKTSLNNHDWTRRHSNRRPSLIRSSKKKGDLLKKIKLITFLRWEKVHNHRFFKREKKRTRGEIMKGTRTKRRKREGKSEEKNANKLSQNFY